MSESLSIDGRPSVTIHVGMGKTGTTSLQAALHRSRRTLRDRGVLYPKAFGLRRHLRLGLALQSPADRPGTAAGWQKVEQTTPAELRADVESRLFAEVRRARPDTVLLSDKTLFIAHRAALLNLRDLLDRLAADVRVVAYLRRQDDHVGTRYQQRVKREGEVVNPGALVVRTFEPARLVGGSLLHDFVDAAAVSVPAEDLTTAPRRNESLEAETVEFLRLRSIYHRERGERPPDDLDRFMDRWAESNGRVVDDFLPGAPDGLFATGRKAAGARTDQREPLRAIAEREATR